MKWRPTLPLKSRGPTAAPIALVALLAASAGACGRDSTASGPTAPDGGPIRLSTVSAGGDHTCALDTRGTAYCWGDDARGQLGDGAPGAAQHPIAVAVRGGPRFAVIAAGGTHTCGLTAAGRAFCWGDDAYGQTGTGSAGGPIREPVAVVGGLRFEKITLGAAHTCGLTAAGRAYCWGSDLFGELGTGSADSVATRPQPVAGGLTFRDLDAGSSHTCALAADGTPYCWGYARFGQLGPDAPTESCGAVLCGRRPARVSGVPALRDLDAGGLHTCGLGRDGRTYCWGADLSGELGDGGTVDGEVSASAVAVSGGVDLVALTLGEHDACGLAANGAAYCWGHGGYGELGNGTAGPTASSDVPLRSAAGLTFASLSAGMFHVCGVTPAGRAYCWGRNEAGQLGDGSTGERARPVLVRSP